MPAETSNFIVVAGDDDFLVDRAAKAFFEKLGADVDADSREIVNGEATKIAEVESALAAFLSATRTISLFGGKKLVWLRNVNWFADGVIRTKNAGTAGDDSGVPAAKGKGAKRTPKKDLLDDAVEKFAEECEEADPATLAVVISVVRPDKRKGAVKKLLQLGRSVPVSSSADPEEAAVLIGREARSRGVSIDDDAARLLVGKVNGHTRMAFSEIEKLACFIGEGGRIDEETVLRLVPVFGEGDFFEPVEFFFTGDLAGTLAALKRYFFNNDSARPLLSALQNRNRLLIQLRALVDAGEAKPNFRGGISKSAIEAAGTRYARHFAGCEGKKTSLNLFSQNVWYVGEKLAGATLRNKSATLKRFIDWQLNFLEAFETLVARPNEDEAIMRELAVRCLGR